MFGITLPLLKPKFFAHLVLIVNCIASIPADVRQSGNAVPDHFVHEDDRRRSLGTIPIYICKASLASGDDYRQYLMAIST